MNVIDNSFEIRREQGFDVYMLGNPFVELAVVPELGAKIISMKDLRTGREWMWHPHGGLKLFRNRFGDDFSTSTLVGADECLPTIAPCRWQGRDLPDHGEVWGVPWEVDHSAWSEGILKTSVHLKITPFRFTRTIELQDNAVRLDYQLENRGTAEEHFLWAMHPLLRLRRGDRLELPSSTRSLLDGEDWIDAVDTVVPEQNRSKVFATPVVEGRAAILNTTTADRLHFEWNPVKNDTLGLWLTRGGWHGHHHFALEATNGDADTLTLAAGRNHSGVVDAAQVASWQLCLRIGV